MYYRRFRNDFYPFVYPELKLFDPTGFEMVRSIFDVGEREGNLNSFAPSGEMGFDREERIVDKYFQITTQRSIRCPS